MMKFIETKISVKRISCRGARSAVRFGFEAKSHQNCKITKHVVWFGLVDFNKIQTKPNQTNAR